MKEDLQSKLVEILSSIQDATGKASDFAIENLPEVVQTYTYYARVSSVADFIFLFALSVLFAKYTHWAYKNPWNHSYFLCDRHKKRSDSNIVAMVASSAISLIFLIASVASINLMVWIAPKAWLIKEIASIIK